MFFRLLSAGLRYNLILQRQVPGVPVPGLGGLVKGTNVNGTRPYLLFVHAGGVQRHAPLAVQEVWISLKNCGYGRKHGNIDLPELGQMS